MTTSRETTYQPAMVNTIGEILPAAARRFGDKVALVVGAKAFSFAELELMSNRVANGLLSVGVEPGDRVTLYGPNCWEWLVAYYAIAKTGAVVNPISSMFTIEEVRYVVADSGARAVVASSEKGIPVLDLVGTAGLSCVVLWGDEKPPGATSFTTWIDEASSDFVPVQRARGDLAAVCYTSGTTGHPKGAMQSHRAVVSAAVGTVVMGGRGPHKKRRTAPAGGAAERPRGACDRHQPARGRAAPGAPGPRARVAGRRRRRGRDRAGRVHGLGRTRAHGPLRAQSAS